MPITDQFLTRESLLEVLDCVAAYNDTRDAGEARRARVLGAYVSAYPEDPDVGRMTAVQAGADGVPLATLLYVRLATGRLPRSGSDDLDADPPFVGLGLITALLKDQVLAWHFGLERVEDLPPDTVR